MTYEQLQQIILDYFCDKCRTSEETKNDLLGISQYCSDLTSTIEGGDDE